MTLAAVIARETVSSVSSSTGFLAANIPPTNKQTLFAVVQAVSGPVRFTVDGTAPTTSLGQRLTTGSKLEIHGSAALTNFRAIDDGGVATLEVVYMGRGGPTP